MTRPGNLDRNIKFSNTPFEWSQLDSSGAVHVAVISCNKKQKISLYCTSGNPLLTSAETSIATNVHKAVPFSKDVNT